jgi:hypothetical protein
MMCTDAEPLLARLADDESSVPEEARDALRSHLAGCAGCRATLEEQRAVAAWLRDRPVSHPRPGLVARVSARIDGEAGSFEGEGWLDLANWRRWSAALVPLAAALLAAAYIDVTGARSSSNGVTASAGVAATFQEYTTADAPALLEQSISGDALFETVLIGSVPAAGDTDVR